MRSLRFYALYAQESAAPADDGHEFKIQGEPLMPEPFLLRLPFGGDLLEEITRAFQEGSVRKAAFNVIGAVRPAVLGFYDLTSRKYSNREFSGMWEIVSCMGNISERDGAVFAHAHAVFSDHNYQCVGGHLMP